MDILLSNQVFLNNLIFCVWRDNLREKEERDEFVENVNRAAANLSYEDLYAQLSILQKSITESAYTEEGKLWMLPMYLRIIQIRKKMNCNLTTFISIMQLLQGCMKLVSFRWVDNCIAQLEYVATRLLHIVYWIFNIANNHFCIYVVSSNHKIRKLNYIEHCDRYQQWDNQKLWCMDL